ncbi:MAG TPA: FecR domain-containing protein [Agriterribacter sp.]|nr:FecR domain-containing protein [Chitinophagaceae bacterium]HRP31055.1 FecR domain-containing protein [Agriterribacter sp.]
MTNEEAKALLVRYNAGLCTEEEKNAIEAWYIMLEKDSDWKWTEEEKQLFSDSLRRRVFGNIERQRSKIVSFKKKRIIWAVAASVAAITVSTVIYALLSNPDARRNVASSAPETTIAESRDVLPGKTGAILTLNNGDQILLDSVKGGQLAVQGTTTISNKKGTLEYTATEHEAAAKVFNTVSTPKGREYALVLSDGTKVWLNSASSVRYPVMFMSRERIVEMSGEAYFEVAAQRNTTGEKIPFTVRVKHDDGSIEEVHVLGTHFNINAYDDEPGSSVTLLEGSVEIAKPGSKSVTITPGQQALIGNGISVNKDADLEAVMAWKNGRFLFRKANIQTVMRQAARWYDIEVNYPGKIPADILSGGLSKNINLSEFLKILEYSEINATIHDKIVDIKPAEPGN